MHIIFNIYSTYRIHAYEILFKIYLKKIKKVKFCVLNNYIVVNLKLISLII